MRMYAMRALVLAFVIILALATMPSSARINEDGDLCWEPDIEFPVPCDEDEE